MEKQRDEICHFARLAFAYKKLFLSLGVWLVSEEQELNCKFY
jgi:hypothetical protein